MIVEVVDLIALMKTLRVVFWTHVTPSVYGPGCILAQRVEVVVLGVPVCFGSDTKVNIGTACMILHVLVV